jgi:zinc protease
MRNFGRSLLLAALASTTAIGGLSASPQPARSPRTASTAKSSQPWAQSISDIKPDPALRFGTLPNGMRYVIMHNATPPGQASVQMRIDAGSLMEKDNQLGLAHFMEHMAFNGTTHIPENDLVADLQRMGLAFGADLNAATGFDETFYQLQLPRTDDAMVDRALFILREQVSEATMKPEDIIDERGVIAGEERLRNTPAQRVVRAQLGFLAKGQKLPDRFPIGDMKIVNSAERARFVDYYNTYYRPSRATLVAVGDFDVDAIEAKIRHAFGDWQPKAPDGPEPDLGTVAPRGAEAKVFTETGATPSIMLNWTKAPDLRPDSEAKRRSDLIRKIAFKVLERRLGELSRADNTPFVNVVVGEGDVSRSVHVATMSANFVPGHWQQTLTTLEQEQRRFVQYGVTDAELQREITVMRRDYDNKADGASTRETRTLATQLVASVDDRKVFTSPQQDRDAFEQTVKGLTAGEVNAAIKPIFTGNGPLVMVTSSEPIEGGEKAVLASLQSAEQVALAPPAAPAVKAWPYTDFGKPGVITKREELADLGATRITFANGVVLLLKHTSFDKDAVSVTVLSGHGSEDFSPDSFDIRPSAMSHLLPGGLGQLTLDETSQALAGHTVAVGFTTLDDHFMLWGNTRPSDLQLTMQDLAAHLTDPAFRSASFEKDKIMYPTMIALNKSVPSAALNFYGGEILAGGDKRKGIIPEATFSQWKIETVRDDLRNLVRSGPIYIVMVGDFSVDQAIAAAANTFGALPPASDVPIAAHGDQRHFPAGTTTPLHFTHTGPAEQALGYISWPGPDAVHDLREARRVNLLNEVLKLRVLAEIRERLALTYSPGVTFVPSTTFAGYGPISITAQTTPQNLKPFFDATDTIVKDLQDKPVTLDELNRAREPQIQALKRGLNNNGWWARQLINAADKPTVMPEILTEAAELETITPADIQALARKYLVPSKAWRAEVTSDQLRAGTTSSAVAHLSGPPEVGNRPQGR